MFDTTSYRVQTLSHSERIASLRLIRTDNVGPVTYKHLMNRYGSASDALDAIPDLAAQGGKKRPLKIPPLAAIERELEAIEHMGAQMLVIGEPDYPVRLAATEDGPPIVFIKGHVHMLSKESIGIVGARNASAAGMRITQTIAGKLSEKGIVITSGLARGIDTAAHSASLTGGTMACLAGGLDIVYPKENERLHDMIAEQGVLITEMPLSTKPQARHFPRRNRLISGLSIGVLVIEAAYKSGSLITARYAADQGREVFAIPGSPLDPRCQGTNKLIKDGAILTQSADDILNELESLRRAGFSEPSSDGDLPLFAAITQTASNAVNPTDSNREAIISLLSHTSVTIDELVRLSDLEAGTVLAIILELELASIAIRYPGNKIALNDID